MSQKYIYQIGGLTKKFGQREVLKDIWLAFYPGAKIGVLGRNGSGKSTLLRIMAGKDKEFDGEAKLTEGFTVGLLGAGAAAQSRRRTCAATSRRPSPTRGRMLQEFEALGDKYAEVADDPDAMEKLMNRQAALQDKIDAANAWELDRQIEIAMDAMNLPPGDADVTKLSGGEKRRVALCKILLEKPDLLLLDEPTNHLDAESVAWLERHLTEYAGTIVAVTHDRYFLDNVAELDSGARPRPGHSVGGQLLVVARAEAQAARARREAGVGPAAHAGPRAGVGSHRRPRPGRPRARPASRPTKRWRPSSSRIGPTSSKSRFRPASGWATAWSRRSTSASPTATA